MDIEEIEEVDATSIKNPNIDIVSTKQASSAQNIYFYLKVDGGIMKGGLIPEILERSEPTPQSSESSAKPSASPQPSQQPVIPIPPLNGYDIARVIIENSGTERFKLEILGKDGIIESRALYRWENNEWTYANDIEAENDHDRIEMGVSLLDLGITNTSSLAIRFEMSDWSGERDVVNAIPTKLGLSKYTYGFNFATLTKGSPDPTWPSEGDWILFANDTVDNKSDGSNIVISNPSLNITDLYYVNSSIEFLYIQIRTMNNTQDWLINRTWMLFIDVDGDGFNDWIVKENSTGLMYFNWSARNNRWEWNNTETLDPTNNDGGVKNYTMYTPDRWVIEFALNKTIIKNGTFSIGSYTKIGVATNNTEDFIVNLTTYQPTYTFLVPAGNFEDIIEPTQIPEFSDIFFPMIFMLGLIFTIRKRYKYKR